MESGLETYSKPNWGRSKIRVQLRLLEESDQQPYSQLNWDRIPGPNLIPKDLGLNHTPRRIGKESKSRSNKDSNSKSSSDDTSRSSCSRRPNSGLTPPLSL
jgi:hypothetical protein